MKKTYIVISLLLISLTFCLCSCKKDATGTHSTKAPESTSRTLSNDITDVSEKISDTMETVSEGISEGISDVSEKFSDVAETISENMSEDMSDIMN